MAKLNQTNTNVIDETNEQLKEPDIYKVVLLNDHYTPMDFVVDILREIFHKNPAEATNIMLEVHKKGKGIAGIYIYDIAATKIQQVERLARSEGYPLRCVLEKE
ncbi:MAG: ATP-dependent Clp protease adapter ClpS [Spirochaetales bacterium]|nr:ATP-dependent Clp protease adapter ClpS [Spirochaetales bacterium]